MSSTSRSPGDAEPAKEPEAEKEKKKRPGSAGRYSLANDADDVPSTRIDSTTRMPAVRPGETAASVAPDAAPSSARGMPPPLPAAAGGSGSGAKALPKKPPLPPARPPPNSTQRAMPAPLASGAAPKAVSMPPQALLPDEDSVAPREASRPPPSRASSPSFRPGATADAAAADKVKAASSNPPRAHAPSVAPRAPSVAPPPLDGRRRSSLRPPPSQPKPSTSSQPPPTPLVLDGFDEGSIAFAFDALVSDGPAGEPGKQEFDLGPVRELFAELAANHMRHVRDFMIDVKWGEVTRDWINICLPPVRTLRKAAERLDLPGLGQALERVGSELDAANAIGGLALDAGEKQRLLDAYDELVKIMPQAFALDRDKTQREAVIVQALLLQVPDVRKVTIDKLHAAGLTSLSVLFEANAEDIAHVAGIPNSLASKIVERVQAYRAEMKNSSPNDARAAEREKLASLNGVLKKHHSAYEEAANGWGPDAKATKRDHFRAREETWLAISVVLARFGEVDRLQGIEKVPFAQRIAQLTDYLEEAREKYRAADQ